jgi:hypothetical protein
MSYFKFFDGSQVPSQSQFVYSSFLQNNSSQRIEPGPDFCVCQFLRLTRFHAAMSHRLDDDLDGVNVSCCCHHMG